MNTGALDRLTGKSREAAEGLVNGGELTTSKGAKEDLSNITRRGTLEDSLHEYERAVEKAGGSVDDINTEIKNGRVRRSYTSDDGTIFQHREFSTKNDVTVDIQIKSPHVNENKGAQPKETIKVRFIEPDTAETNTPLDGSADEEN